MAISATAYGATGNGVTDDTAAIDQAIKAAQTGGGGVVQFPCGSFFINSSVNSPLGGNVLLYEPNLANIILQGQGSCTHLFSTQLNKSTIEIDNSTNVTVTNMRVTAQNGVFAQGILYYGGSAITCSHTLRCNITRVEIDGASAPAVHFTNGTTFSSLTSSYIHGTSSAGVVVDSCSATTDLICAASTAFVNDRIADNVFQDAGLIAGSGAITLTVGDTVVAGNNISFSPSTASTNPQLAGVYVTGAVDYQITNNIVSNSPSDCIALSGYGGGSVADNRVISCGHIGISYNQNSGTMTYLALTGNVLEAIQDQGIYLVGTPGLDDGFSGVIVDGTYVYGGGSASPGNYDAISLVGTTGARVSNTFVNGGGAYRHAVHIDATAVNTNVDNVQGYNLASTTLADDSGASMASQSAPFSAPISHGTAEFFAQSGNHTAAYFVPGDDTGTTYELYGANSTNSALIWWIYNNGNAKLGATQVSGLTSYGLGQFYGHGAGQPAGSFVPVDNAAGTKEVYGANAANSAFVWWVNDDGSASFSSYSGPTTAPTGSCSVNGVWVFSQDGHATFCASGTWTTKL